MSHQTQISPTQTTQSPVAETALSKFNESPQNEQKNNLLFIQPKLSIGSPDDPYEKEADSVANQIMRMPDTSFGIQRKCAACEHDEEKIQRKPFNITPIIQKSGINGGGVASDAVSSQIESSRGGGSQLDGNTRSFMESRFGQDFSDVKIHTDSNAIQLSQNLNAQAFTVGNDIFFNQGKYSPDSDSGKHLLAHELTHTVQQDGGIGRKVQRLVGNGHVYSLSNVVVNLPHNITFTGERGNLTASIDTVIVAGSYELTFNESANELLVTGAPLEHRFNVSLSNATHRTIETYQGYLNYLSSHHVPLVINEATPQTQPVQPHQPTTTDPNAVYLDPEEAMRRCQSGDLPGIKTFPFRPTRFGAALMTVRREGEFIVVKLPVHVFTDNSNFHREIRTLPLDTYTSGVRLRPNELVRVRTYSPHWYQLNITGSAESDEEQVMCVTGEQMLAFGEASDTAVMTNMALTAVDAATLFVPVGRLAQPLMRAGRVGVAAIGLGLHEAAPVAFGGAASRATTMIVEEQVEHVIFDQAVRRSVAQTIIRPLEAEAAQVTLGQTTQAGLGGLTHAALDATGRTALTSTVDSAVGGVLREVVTPDVLPTPPISVPQANPFAEMGLAELRQLARTNAEATWALRERYLTMPYRSLQALAREGDSMAAAVIEQRGAYVSQALERTIARNPRSINPAVQEQLTAELANVRGASGIPRATSVITEGAEETGTMGVARTDIPSLSSTTFEGASPRAGGTPDITFTPASSNALFQGHAEQNLAGRIHQAIQQGLQNGTLTLEGLNGRTVFMRIEQEVCAICRASNGVLTQLSARYPTVTFEVAAEGTSEILIFRAGRLVN